jgi:hypothetical protein
MSMRGSVAWLGAVAAGVVLAAVGLQLRDDSGPITTSVQSQPGTTVTITIMTGRSARAPIAWTWSDGSGTRCRAPNEVAVTLPGDTAAATAPWVAGDAASVCHGVVKVYPFTS